MDWRVETYNGELNGKEFFLRKFVTIPASNPMEIYDHDHCEFCWQKITDLDIPDSDAQGYVTLGYVGETDEKSMRKHWVCEKCFNDFKERFDFRIKK